MLGLVKLKKRQVRSMIFTYNQKSSYILVTLNLHIKWDTSHTDLASKCTWGTQQNIIIKKPINCHHYQISNIKINHATIK